MQWKGLTTPLEEALVSGLHTGIRPQMLIGVQMDPLGLKDHRFENIVKFVIPINRFYAGNGRGFLFGVFLTLP